MTDRETMGAAFAAAVAAEGVLVRPVAWRGSGVACVLDDRRKREGAALLMVPVGPAGRGLCPRFTIAEYLGPWETLDYRTLTAERDATRPRAEGDHA